MQERPPSSWRPWLQRFAEQAGRDETLAEFVEHVDTAIMAQMPEIANDPVLVQDLHASTRAHWQAFTMTLPSEDYRFAMPEQPADLARALVRRGIALDALLRIYRIANQGVFSFLTGLTDRFRDGAPPRDEVLVFVWLRASQWITDSVEALIEIDYEERHHLRESAMARRRELVDQLLHDTVEPTAQLEERLGHPLRLWQTAFVISAEQASDEAAGAMQEAALAAARAIGAPPPLTLVAGARDLWAWAATPTEPTGGLDDLADRLTEFGLRLTVGRPTRGPAGFRHSHDEARAAHRLAISAPRAPSIVPYDDVELLCLLGADDDLVTRMVRREAGALCGDDKNTAAIRETVLAFLSNHSLDAVAQQLFIHKNTVRYRLGRAEELLGHPVTEHAAHLELALRHVALHGSPSQGV